jgi:Fic family protein
LLEDLLEDYKETKEDITDLIEERKELTDEEEIEGNESSLEFLQHVIKEEKQQIKLLQNTNKKIEKKTVMFLFLVEENVVTNDFI